MKINKVYVVKDPYSRESEIFDYAFKTNLDNSSRGSNHLVFYILGSVTPDNPRQWFTENTSVYTTKEDAVDDACERYRKIQGLKRCPSGIRAALEDHLTEKSYHDV